MRWEAISRTLITKIALTEKKKALHRAGREKKEANESHIDGYVLMALDGCYGQCGETEGARVRGRKRHTQRSEKEEWKENQNNIPENRSCPASRPHPVRRGIKN